MSATVQRHGVRASELARIGVRLGTILVLAVLPTALLFLLLWGSFHSAKGSWANDFNGNFRIPGNEILHGLSPYNADELVRVRTAVAAGQSPNDFNHGVFSTYPAPALLVGVPFAWLPQALAEWLWAGLMLGAGWLGLHLLGVRDWRVYAAALFTPAAFSSLLFGSVDFAVVLGLAACWRWRDHATRAGIALGVLVALKLIALPMIVWLVATRRWAAAGVSLAVAGALACIGWAVIGFDGLAGYPHLLSLLTDIEATRGFSAVTYANLVGISGHAATYAPWVVSACLAAALWVVSRRREGGDEAAFFLGVLLVLAFSPIVWHHYLVLLIIPMAVYYPAFKPIWALPMLCWVVWGGAFISTGWIDRVVFLLVIVGVSVWALGGRSLAAGAHARVRSLRGASESITPA